MWNEEGDRQDDIFVIEFLLLKKIKNKKAVACLGLRSDERIVFPVLLFEWKHLFLKKITHTHALQKES